MYSVSSDFNKAVLNNARRIEAHIVFKEKSYDIQKCTVDNNIYSTDNDAFIGTFIAKSGTIKINRTCYSWKTSPLICFLVYSLPMERLKMYQWGL